MRESSVQPSPMRTGSSRVAHGKKKYCIYLGEFLDNPAKLAHEQEYEEWCKKDDPVEALLESFKRHFKDHKKGRAQEWVNFWREPGEELPALLFQLQSLAHGVRPGQGQR
jgi:hypothetical protein